METISSLALEATDPKEAARLRRKQEREEARLRAYEADLQDWRSVGAHAPDAFERTDWTGLGFSPLDRPMRW